MAEPNFSYAEQPPWLRNDAQYDSGPFTLGVQTAQRNKDRALDERRLSVVEAEAPYRQKLLQQESEMTQFKLDDALRQRDQLLEAEREARLLPSVTDSLLQEGEALKAFSELLRAAGKKPILWSSPTFNQQLKSVGEAVKSTISADKITELEARHKAQFDAKTADIEARERIAAQQRESIERVAAERNRNRLEISQMRGGAIQEKLTPEDAAAMRAEFTAARDEGLVGDALQQRIDEINAKYSAKRKGEAVPAKKELDAIDQREEAIQEELLQLQLDLAKDPKKGMLDFGEDNRVLKIKELQRELRELNGLRSRQSQPAVQFRYDAGRLVPAQ